ncbi:hypothetical protein RIF29_38067 [Crotalaria pallida]|uniref:DUF4283 domain-containing protein n=1 Tax=Crotalaria pallida TaxID=3830 RepID=A0AAN9DYG3_CROPI
MIMARIRCGKCLLQLAVLGMCICQEKGIRKEEDLDLKSVQQSGPQIVKNCDPFLGVQSGGMLQGAWKKSLVARKDQPQMEEKAKSQHFACYLEFNVPKEEMDKHRVCYVGKLCRPEEVATIQDSFFKGGFMSLKATHMGGRYVLLHGSNSEEIPDLLFSEKKWFEDRFVEVQRWTPSFSVVERFTWVLCYGVPVHAWSEALFCQLASSVGALARLDPSKAAKERLDVGRILVSTELSSIDVNVKVKVNGSDWIVRMMEEPTGGFISVRKLFGVESDVSSDSDDEDMTSTAEGRLFGAELSSDCGSESNSDEVAGGKEDVQNAVVSENEELNSNLRQEGVGLAYSLESEDAETLVPSSTELVAVQDNARDEEVSFCPDSLGF